jgi:hypothetical protein
MYIIQICQIQSTSMKTTRPSAEFISNFRNIKLKVYLSVNFDTDNLERRREQSNLFGSEWKIRFIGTKVASLCETNVLAVQSKKQLPIRFSSLNIIIAHVLYNSYCMNL